MAACEIPIAPSMRVHYADALRALTDGGIDFLVGGGFALFSYLQHWRATKDLDAFVRPGDIHAALAVLESAGFEVELTDPRWLGKARRGGSLTDLIFCSYNGLFPVDESWFARARHETIFGVPCKVVAPEEMIVSKCFVAARDRFDGSDISWLLRSLGAELDWSRIEALLGDEHWPVLLFQLVHFLYVFPGEGEVLPPGLLERLARRLVEAGPPGAREGDAPCRGRMLDPQQYRVEVEKRAQQPRHLATVKRAV